MRFTHFLAYKYKEQAYRKKADSTMIWETASYYAEKFVKPLNRAIIKLVL